MTFAFVVDKHLQSACTVSCGKRIGNTSKSRNNSNNNNNKNNYSSNNKNVNYMKQPVSFESVNGLLAFLLPSIEVPVQGADKLHPPL